MTQETFHQLVHEVMEQGQNVPEVLFAGGMDNWHARARLAHFLALPPLEHKDEAHELFLSVAEAPYSEESAEEVEEYAYAMQRLSALERADGKLDSALRHIGLAIEAVEETDFLYKYILRGEVWADRWNLMHQMDMTKDAEAEADERIDAFKDLPEHHNSYLYYGYRFKAQLAAERGVPLVAKDYMHMALHSMEIPEKYQEGIDTAFAATHDNVSWILTEIDKATPHPDTVHWDI